MKVNSGAHDRTRLPVGQGRQPRKIQFAPVKGALPIDPAQTATYICRPRVTELIVGAVFLVVFGYIDEVGAPMP